MGNGKFECVFATPKGENVAGDFETTAVGKGKSMADVDVRISQIHTQVTFWIPSTRVEKQIPSKNNDSRQVDTKKIRIWRLRGPCLVYVRTANFVFCVNTGLMVVSPPLYHRTAHLRELDTSIPMFFDETAAVAVTYERQGNILKTDAIAVVPGPNSSVKEVRRDWAQSFPLFHTYFIRI